MREVAGAITSSTIATAAVFVPIGLVGGMVGELFRPFAFTAALALLASLLVALTIVPVLAYWFVRGPRTDEDPEEFRAAAEAKERSGLLQRSYLGTLRAALARPWLAVLAALAVMAGTVGVATQLETQFIGDTGQNTLTVTQELPAGTSLQAADAAAQPGEHLQRLLGVGENAGYVGIDPGAGKRALDEDGHAKPGHVEIAALPVQRSHHAWIEPHADRLLRQIDAAFAAHAHERAEQAQIPGPGDAVLDIERNGKLRELGFPGSVLVVAAADQRLDIVDELRHVDAA